MSEKTLALITAIVGGLAAIASGVVTYINPAHASAINSAIDIVQTAAIEICILFTAKATSKLLKK